MTAREKFKIGDFVTMSAKGLARPADLRRFDRPTKGRVTGFSRHHEWNVMILRDGRLTTIDQHMDWWDVVESSRVPDEAAP